MAKQTVLVCLPGEPADPYEAVAAALAPFDESLRVEPYRDHLDREREARKVAAPLGRDPATLTWAEIVAAHNARYPRDPYHLDEATGRAYAMCTDNPAGRWDYWGIGLLGDGYFTYRDGHEHRVLRGDPADWDPPRTLAPTRCDGGPVASLDLDGMRAAAGAEAGAAFDRWYEAAADMPAARPWPEFLARTDAVAGYTPADALGDFTAQPRVRALLRLAPGHRVEDFQRSRRVAVAAARARAVPAGALLTVDGEWLERLPDELDDGRYLAAANLDIDTMPGTAWLVAAGYHH